MNILVVAAHRDDEVLGCGGTVARSVQNGDDVHIHILGETRGSRWVERDEGDRVLVDDLAEHAQAAGATLGATTVTLHDLPDNRFDTVPMLDIVKIVEAAIDEVAPSVVYTHHGGDLNVDHVATHRAVLTATRPLPGGGIDEVLAFEVPSSTEWSFQRLGEAFRPNVFVDVSDTLATKLRALACYESEARRFPHPRSEEAVSAAARRWGSVAGLLAAEPFESIRSIRR
jgi:LmbE family N-acetylglucosaminyl deacetylase